MFSKAIIIVRELIIPSRKRQLLSPSRTIHPEFIVYYEAEMRVGVARGGWSLIGRKRHASNFLHPARAHF